MTLEKSTDRITAILKLQKEFERQIEQLDDELALRLLGSSDLILNDPKVLAPLLQQFQRAEFTELLKKFGADLLTIQKLNEIYFRETVGEIFNGTFVSLDKFAAVREAVAEQMTERFGITATGKIVSGGQFDLIAQDTTVRLQLQRFAYSQKVQNIGLSKFKDNLRSFVKGSDSGNPNLPATGINNRHLNTFAYDTYQQVDRAAQNGFSAAIGITAFLFLGGIISGSRSWCKVRDGHCYLRSEIEKFGTKADKYGGYKDKSVGYFYGKPKGQYNPFNDQGGHGCRHHYSGVSNREAILRRPDLELSDSGILRIKS